MDTVEETIFENGSGLRISVPTPSEPAVEEETADVPPAAAPAEAAEPRETWEEQRLYRVVLNLANGEWLEVGSFLDEASADGHARDIATRLAQANEWPRVRGRYIRPETILSIEISERRRPSGS
jgi:hypothetical protein